MTPLEAAYMAYPPGSARFHQTVDLAVSYQVTQAEARRITLQSESAAAWERTWRDETWRRDESCPEQTEGA